VVEVPDYPLLHQALSDPFGWLIGFKGISQSHSYQIRKANLYG
jgi:hypothetical protein